MDLRMTEADLTAVLDLADDTEHAITSGIAADPATAGRITVRFPVGDLPADARIAGILVHGAGRTRFRRWFTPHLTVPPGGTLSVSFGIEDMRNG